jgi:hypothetical protein
MDYKEGAAKDTAEIEVHIEPSFVNVPFSTLLANPANPQVPGAPVFSLSFLVRLPYPFPFLSSSDPADVCWRLDLA